MDFAEALKSPGVIWFVAGLILILSEFALPGLIILFFGIGAWTAAASYFIFQNGLTTQLTIFLIVSLISLALLRKSLKAKLFDSKQYKDEEIEEYANQQATVSEQIKTGVEGKVMFHGTSWKATSTEDIEVGETVVVNKRTNLTLVVSKLV